MSPFHHRLKAVESGGYIVQEQEPLSSSYVYSRPNVEGDRRG